MRQVLTPLPQGSLGAELRARGLASSGDDYSARLSVSMAL